MRPEGGRSEHPVDVSVVVPLRDEAANVDLLLDEFGAGHQATFDDGRGDRVDDAVGGARCRARRALRVDQAKGGAGFAGHDGVRLETQVYTVLARVCVYSRDCCSTFRCVANPEEPIP